MPDTSDIARQKLNRYLTNNWTACPVGFVGLSFDIENSLDISPFTVGQLRDSATADGVGYLMVDHEEIASRQVTTGGSCSIWITTERMTITVRTPDKRGSAVSSKYLADLTDLYRHVQISNATPAFTIAQTSGNPIRRRQGSFSQGGWRYDWLDIPTQRQETVNHAGLQEVAL